jgi:hypothetical protein
VKSLHASNGEHKTGKSTAKLHLSSDFEVVAEPDLCALSPVKAVHYFVTIEVPGRWHRLGQTCPGISDPMYLSGCPTMETKGAHLLDYELLWLTYHVPPTADRRPIKD